MNCKDIIKKYLEDNGYEGLFNDEDNCGCSIEDLFVCEGDFGFIATCEPGYKQPGDDECDYYIGPEKPGGKKISREHTRAD